MARLAYSPDAVADLEEIAAFSVSRFGRDVTDAYLAGLEAACELLDEFPQLAAAHPRLKPEMRCLTYRSHRIFYRFESDEVLIARILHHARDIRRALG